MSNVDSSVRVRVIVPWWGVADNDERTIHIEVAGMPGGPWFHDSFFNRGRKGGQDAIVQLYDSLAYLLLRIGPEGFKRDLGELVLHNGTIEGLPEEFAREDMYPGRGYNLGMTLRMQFSLKNVSFFKKYKMRKFVEGVEIAARPGGKIRSDRGPTPAILALGVIRIPGEIRPTVAEYREKDKGIFLFTGSDWTVIKPDGVTLVRLPDIFE